MTNFQIAINTYAITGNPTWIGYGFFGFLVFLVISPVIIFILAVWDRKQRQIIREADPEYQEYQRLYEKFRKM